jgi:glyoxylase-like metal-dependent hydrolase (beta-lactamase superfamily II)
MKLGRFTIQEVLFGDFRLDGGCMFGSVPKNLWSKSIPADEENCIPLVCRSLLIRDKDRIFLVDVGMGEKWGDKQRQIFAIQNTPATAWGFSRDEVTDIILTHLHFDHAGGITHYNAANEAVLSFPNARIHLQEANWTHAQNPTPKDRASYLPENILPLRTATLSLYQGDSEIHPGISVHRVDGHTPGQQWIEIRDDGASLFFATDLIPTTHHISLPYHMGYDVCAATLLAEKKEFLERAVNENAIVCFQHDRDTPAVRVTRDARGQYSIKDRGFPQD